MINKYQNVSIVYGGKGQAYAEILKNKIDYLAETERYPLSATIIMESILTKELLSEVVKLFKESEWCVIFLTADDLFVNNESSTLRLRQNVVFETGMALIELGRERCIFLCDFDINANGFELPSDMNSLEICRFLPDEILTVLDHVIEKILQGTTHSIHAGTVNQNIPKYDLLLSRKFYFLDYENLFPENDYNRTYEGKKYILKTIEKWEQECATLTNYDERCIYLLERLGFLPVFGDVKEAEDFLIKAAALVANYTQKDILYYEGTRLLNYTKVIVESIIEYTKIKRYKKQDLWKYEDILDQLPEESRILEEELNPLIKLVYYNYRGLTYLRIYRISNDSESLEKAKKCFERAMVYTEYVDMGMELWSGFITYNLARVLANQGDMTEAEKAFKTAIRIRREWVQKRGFNATIRNAISSEYFIAKMDYIEICEKKEIKSKAWIDDEWERMEIELNAYSNMDEEIDVLVKIRDRLLKRKQVF